MLKLVSESVWKWALASPASCCCFISLCGFEIFQAGYSHLNTNNSDCGQALICLQEAPAGPVPVINSHVSPKLNQSKSANKLCSEVFSGRITSDHHVVIWKSLPEKFPPSPSLLNSVSRENLSEFVVALDFSESSSNNAAQKKTQPESRFLIRFFLTSSFPMTVNPVLKHIIWLFHKIYCSSLCQHSTHKTGGELSSNSVV